MGHTFIQVRMRQEGTGVPAASLQNSSHCHSVLLLDHCREGEEATWHRTRMPRLASAGFLSHTSLSVYRSCVTVRCSLSLLLEEGSPTSPGELQTTSCKGGEASMRAPGVQHAIVGAVHLVLAD